MFPLPRLSRPSDRVSAVDQPPEIELNLRLKEEVIVDIDAGSRTLGELLRPFHVLPDAPRPDGEARERAGAASLALRLIDLTRREPRPLERCCKEHAKRDLIAELSVRAATKTQSERKHKRADKGASTDDMKSAPHSSASSSCP